MIKSDKVVVVDVDGTLTIDGSGKSYADARASESMKSRLLALKSEGYWIILFTSRNMRTHDGNIGAIMKHTAPILIEWLRARRFFGKRGWGVTRSLSLW